MPFLPLRARPSSTSEGGRRDDMTRKARLRHARQVPWAVIIQRRLSFQATAKFSSTAPTSVMKGSTLPTPRRRTMPSTVLTRHVTAEPVAWDSMLAPPP